MTIYYVDNLKGLDSNSGLTISEPLENLNSALQKSVDNDKVFIIPTDKTYTVNNSYFINKILTLESTNSKNLINKPIVEFETLTITKDKIFRNLNIVINGLWNTSSPYPILQFYDCTIEGKSGNESSSGFWTNSGKVIILNCLIKNFRKGVSGVYSVQLNYAYSPNASQLNESIVENVTFINLSGLRGAPSIDLKKCILFKNVVFSNGTLNGDYIVEDVIYKNKYGYNEIKTDNKVLFKHKETFMYFSKESESWIDLGINVTKQDYLDYGLEDLSIIPQSNWEELSDYVELKYFTDLNSIEHCFFKIETEPFSVYDYISDNPQLIIYNESTDDLVVSTTVEPFSVYDYISELPTVVAYTESTDDITVSTTTEPYDLYDEFGDELEVLYYTDDDSVKEADLILEANWSPIDELDGDFEVVTWTDEGSDTAQRVLEMTAIPKPQFVKLVNPKRLYGYLEDVVAIDASKSYRDEVRYFVSDDSSNWLVWDKKTNAFAKKDTSTDKLVLENGMKFGELNAITDAQWKTWGKEYLNIGIFLKDNPRDTIVSVVESVSYKDFLPRHSTKLSDSSLYILNTTAKIDISLEGNTIKGVLSDADLTRVQYRVILNGEPYFPTDGTFTKLGQSPQNISLAFSNKDIKIDDYNTLKVEFQDFFGTIDYWSTQFIGTYSGLLFKDVYGQYYSSEIGEVLQYLDFGVIIAGQTTVEHEIVLKNQYGYDVKNIQLSANTTNFPQGMTAEFSQSLSPFEPSPQLSLSNTLKNNEEMSFFVRLKTILGATPDANGSFDIIVRADKA